MIGKKTTPVYFEPGDIATVDCVNGYGATAHTFNGDRGSWFCSHCGGETRPAKPPEVKRLRDDDDVKQWTPPAQPVSAKVSLRDGTSYEFPLASLNGFGFHLSVKPIGEAGGFGHPLHELDRIEFTYGRDDA